MKEYIQVITDALPLMLKQESKGEAAIKISSYMNALLRTAKTECDLRAFGEILSKCKEFSLLHNLTGLNKACSDWDHEGVIKFNQINGLNQQSITQNYDKEVEQKLQEYLMKTSSEINKVGMIEVDDFQSVLSQLDQIETSLIATGIKYLSKEQIQKFMNEISNQRNQIRMNCSMIDEILESSHLAR